MPTLVCPYCRKNPSPDRSTPEGRRLFPFCSERCKLADLGAWAAEKYSVPASGGDDDDEDGTRIADEGNRDEGYTDEGSDRRTPDDEE